MSEKSGNNTAATVIISFLSGAAAGAIAGILFAPDKGSNTRDKIATQTKNLTSEVGDNVNAKVDSLKEYISGFMNEVKGRFTELENEMKEKAEDARNKAAKKVETKAKEVQS